MNEELIIAVRSALKSALVDPPELQAVPVARLVEVLKADMSEERAITTARLMVKAGVSLARLFQYAHSQEHS